MCPAWCTLTPGHRWDSTGPDGRHSRGHGDVQFGRFITGGAVEYEDAPGVWEHSVTLYADTDDLAPADLLELAHNAAEAAWLTLQTPFVKRDRV